MQLRKVNMLRKNYAVLKRKFLITTKFTYRRGVRWFRSFEQYLLFAQTSQGTSDGSNGVSGCISSWVEFDTDFIFTFHTCFVGEADFEEGAYHTIFSSLFSTVTGALSIDGTTSSSEEISFLGYRSSYLDASPS
jgi:hypothetical protein